MVGVLEVAPSRGVDLCVSDCGPLCKGLWTSV
jgi:hypothetical protein